LNKETGASAATQGKRRGPRLADHVRKAYDAAAESVRRYNAKFTELAASGRYTDSGLSEAWELRELQGAGAVAISKLRAAVDRQRLNEEDTRRRIENGSRIRGADGNFQDIKPLASRLEGLNPAALMRLKWIQEQFDRKTDNEQWEVVAQELRKEGPHSELLTAIEMEIPLVHELSPRIRETIARGRLEYSGWQDTYQQRVFAYENLQLRIGEAAAALALAEEKRQPERT
jgi:hypothetical protein